MGYITSISLESTEMRGGLHNLQKELDVVKKANAESDKKDPFEKVMGKFFGEASTQVKELVGKVEQLMADNKELYTYYCGTKEMCLATVFIEFGRDFEHCVKSNQEREERIAKAAEKKKRNKLKNKSTKTSIKKKKNQKKNHLKKLLKKLLKFLEVEKMLKKLLKKLLKNIQNQKKKSKF